jgi:hypothetical protein
MFLPLIPEAQEARHGSQRRNPCHIEMRWCGHDQERTWDALPASCPKLTQAVIRFWRPRRLGFAAITRRTAVGPASRRVPSGEPHQNCGDRLIPSAYDVTLSYLR